MTSVIPKDGNGVVSGFHFSTMECYFYLKTILALTSFTLGAHSFTKWLLKICVKES